MGVLAIAEDQPLVFVVHAQPDGHVFGRRGEAFALDRGLFRKIAAADQGFAVIDGSREQVADFVMSAVTIGNGDGRVTGGELVHRVADPPDGAAYAPGDPNHRPPNEQDAKPYCREAWLSESPCAFPPLVRPFRCLRA